MRQILVIYECDNGYKCGCCNQEWEENELHDIPDGQDVKDFLKEEQKRTTEWYKRDAGSWYGKFKILKAYIVTDEFDMEN